MKTLTYTLLLPLLALLSAALEAVEVDNLYAAQMPVKSQTRIERLEVYPGAMSQVIVKLTGDTGAPRLPQLRGTIARARQLVQQFNYAKLPEEGTELLREEGYQRLLAVQFDAKAVNQALVAAGVPVWGKTRPLVLVWLAVEDRGARYLLGAGRAVELESQLLTAGERRGLPLILPLLDLEEQSQISFADVWGDFSRPLWQAAERYAADALLVGRLFRDEGAWQVRWTLHQKGDQQSRSGRSQRWRVEGASQAELLNRGIDEAATEIAHRFAQILSVAGDHEIALRVDEINTLSAYARTLRYLQSLDQVVSVQVEEVEGREVAFRLALRGEPKGLQRTIALGSVLSVVESVVDKELSYRLLP